MIRIILATVLAAAAPVAFSQTLLSPSGKFTENGKITGTTETGAKDGVLYRFSRGDGSGVVAGSPDSTLGIMDLVDSNWSARCSYSPAVGTKFCQISRDGLVVTAYSDGQLQVSIGGRKLRGSPVVLRVADSGPLTTLSETGIFPPDDSAEIIELLQSGGPVATSYVEWPSGAVRDGSFKAYGFKSALSYITWAVQQIR